MVNVFKEPVLKANKVYIVNNLSSSTTIGSPLYTSLRITDGTNKQVEGFYTEVGSLLKDCDSILEFLFQSFHILLTTESFSCKSSYDLLACLYYLLLN
jgi:hypothetical protein